MRIHSPSRTYNQGDRCYIYHTLDNVTQKYTLESKGLQRGSLNLSAWNIITPRVWRLSTLDQNGYVLPGDTIFVANNGYKNSTNGCKVIREFQNYTKDLYAYPTIYSDVDISFLEFGVENSYREDFAQNTVPNWNKNFSRAASAGFMYLLNTVVIKVTTIDEPKAFLSAATPIPHTLTLDKGVYEDWDLISVPDSTYLNTITYNLSATPDDFQVFIIINNAGTLSVEKLPVNVEF